MSEAKIITYTNLLHKYRDPNAEAVKKFVDEHKDDKQFLKRVATLKKVFQLKKELVDC